MQERDKGSKWLIGFHADALVRLAGIRRIASWKAVQAEPVEPRRLPDGLIEVYRRGRPRPILVALEVSTYPYGRLAKQAADDALLIYLVRGVVPEVITLILRPRGRKPVPRELVIRQRGGDDEHPRRVEGHRALEGPGGGVAGGRRHRADPAGAAVLARPPVGGDPGRVPRADPSGCAGR